MQGLKRRLLCNHAPHAKHAGLCYALSCMQMIAIVDKPVIRAANFCAGFLPAAMTQDPVAFSSARWLPEFGVICPTVPDDLALLWPYLNQVDRDGMIVDVGMRRVGVCSGREDGRVEQVNTSVHCTELKHENCMWLVI